MYYFCYTDSLRCIVNELVLWSDISSEHPIFITTVAKFSNIKLSQNTVNKLMEINKEFTNLNKKAMMIKAKTNDYNYLLSNVEQIRMLSNEFLILDKKFIDLLPEVKQYGKDNKVWQTLLDHITHEQKYMYELFTNIKMQLK